MTAPTPPPQGTLDLLPSQAELHSRAQRRLLAVLRAHGYREVQVPVYEPFALYERLYGPEIRNHLITFDTDREYALRPDLTAGVLRAQLRGLSGAPWTPLRSAAAGPSFRHERPRPLRLRQFQQIGLERVGDQPDQLQGADLEILSLARLCLAELGLAGGFLRVGHAGLRDQLLEAISPDPAARDHISGLWDVLSRLRERLEPLRTTLDLVLNPDTGERRRLDPLQHEELGHLLDELRRKLARHNHSFKLDRQADTSRQALALREALEGALCEAMAACGHDPARQQAMLRLCEPSASLDELADEAAPLLDLRQALHDALGHIEACAPELDPCVLRFGLGASRWSGFYTGFFFEVDAPVLGPDVSQVLGGGRYDGAAQRLGGPPLAACGFGLGLERCLAAATALHGPEALRQRLVPQEPVLICFGQHPQAATRAADLAEELGRRGCAIAYHPTAVTRQHPQGGLTEEDLHSLAQLPGQPYRHALLVEESTWVANLDNGSCFEADLQTLLMMFARS